MKKTIVIFLLFFGLLCSGQDLNQPLSSPYVISKDGSFGYRDFNIKGGSIGSYHMGIDLVPQNKHAQVLAVKDGVVSVVYGVPGTKNSRGVVFKGHPVYGALIVISHGNGFYTLYAHLSDIFVNEGQSVKKGQALGIVGTTGQSTGIHLHFETLMDPNVMLKGLLDEDLNEDFINRILSLK